MRAWSTWRAVVASILLLGFVAPVGTGSAAAASWRAAPAPMPAGASSASLNGVSCVRSTLCWAVGMATLAHHRRQGFVERWSGRSWQLEPVPLPARLGQTGLFGISCGGPSSCMAVGSTGVNQGGTFSELWRAGRWRYVATPSPSDTALGAVSCSSPSDCLAVGSTDTFLDGILNYSLNLVWNGTVWTRQPYHETGSLNGVSCPSASFCAAVGLISDSAGNNSVAERWNGTQIDDVPSGDGRAGSLQGVSCRSANFCMAVGSAFGRIATLWDGARWHAIGSPDGLDAVSCPDSTRCVAVGSRIASWNGTHWAVVPASVTAHSGLSSVTCSGPSTCLAVGSSGSRPFALREG